MTKSAYRVTIIEVDITGFSPEYTYARTPDCPVANHQSECEVTVQPAGVSTITYSIQGESHGATIDSSTGVVTPSTTQSGEISVRATATSFPDCYDEEPFLIKARPISIESSVVPELETPVGGAWTHTFNGTGGSLADAQVIETVTMTRWPFRGYVAPGDSTWSLDEGGTMTSADNLWQPDYDFYASDFLPSPPKDGLPQSSLEHQEYDWVCPMCWATRRDIEQGEASIVFTFSENTDAGHPEDYVIQLQTGYNATGEPICHYTDY